MTEARAHGRVLVIKHGALGDIVLATGPFAAIRRHHADAELVLLTTAPYAALARASPYFDEVWVDERPGLCQPRGILRLRRLLREGGFSRVYDLQTSDRSSAYYHLFARPRPEWSGIARGASHPHRNPKRDAMHTIERQREQLADAGIADVPPPDIAWLDGDLTRFALPERFALLVPGGAAHRPRKRWPAGAYARLAAMLKARGFDTLLIGAAADRAALDAIAAAAPSVINLGGRTSLGQIAALARRAALAIGNDTGPVHVIAAAGCPCVVLYSRASDPALTAPRGGQTEIIAVDDLAHLAPETVAAALKPR
jgi:ADP-heptose:LPS heptosyltransferase